MPLKATFTQAFLPAYLRNNRRGGQKNLRCFPACSEQGHRCSGFCGRAVKVSWSEEGKSASPCSAESAPPATSTTTPLAQYCSLAEFVTEKKEKQDVRVGGVYPVEQFEDDTRCRKQPLRRFVRGVPAAAGSSTAVSVEDFSTPPSSPGPAPSLPINAAICTGPTTFSYKPSCWHYSWRSNKHATETKHWLRVFVFRLSADLSEMECVSIADTTSFTLFSSKILDKTAKRGAPPAPIAKNERQPKKKKLKRSRTVEATRKMTTPPPTERKEPFLFVPTYKFAFEPIPVAPSSPVSITFFEDDKFGEVEHTPMSLDALLETMDVPKDAVARGPDTAPISEITESVLDEVSSDMETSSFEDSLLDLLDASF